MKEDGKWVSSPNSMKYWFKPDFSKYKYKHLAHLLIDKWGYWTQAEKKLGYSQNCIRRAVAGESQPKKDMIDTILSGLGITYEEAFQEDNLKLRGAYIPKKSKNQSKEFIDRMFYKNLAETLIKRYGSLRATADEIGATPESIKRTLAGKSVPYKYIIDDLLTASGLTYEQAFEEDFE